MKRPSSALERLARHEAKAKGCFVDFVKRRDVRVALTWMANLEAVARAARNYVPWLCDSWPGCDCDCAKTCEDKALRDTLAALKEADNEASI